MSTTRSVSNPLDDPARTARQKAADLQRRTSIEANGVPLDVPGYGLILKVRHLLPDRYGQTRFAYYSDVAGYPLILDPGCDRAQFEDVASSLHLIEIRDESDLIAAEIHEFRATWPKIAALLGPTLAPTQAPAPTAVPLGTKRRPSAGTGTINESHWREYLTRHAAGDFGVYGQLSGITLTAAARAAAALYDVGTRNAVAIEAGSGVVRSRFPIPPALAEGLGRGSFRHPAGEPPVCVGTIDIGTLLVPNQTPMTVCHLGRADQQCFGA